MPALGGEKPSITPKSLCALHEPCHPLRQGSQSRAVPPRACPGGQGSFQPPLWHQDTLGSASPGPAQGRAGGGKRRALHRLDLFLGKHGRGAGATIVTAPRQQQGHADRGGLSAEGLHPSLGVSGGYWPCRAGWDKAGSRGGSMLAGGANAAPRAPPNTGLGGQCAEHPRAAGTVPAASKVLAHLPHQQRDLTPQPVSPGR